MDSTVPNDAFDKSLSNDKKRLRITRACDFCRRKKVKCYFTPGEACTNCVSYGVSCEFNHGTKKRGPPKGYIDALEKRIQQIENILTSLPANVTKSEHDDYHEAGTVVSATSSSDLTEHGVHKKTAGGKSDSVQYLGDLSSFQFFSHKIKLDGSERMWHGQRLRRFGKQMVLIDEENFASQAFSGIQPPTSRGVSQPVLTIPKIKTLFPRKDIHNWIYSVSGVDNQTSDRLLKIYFANVHPVLPVVNKKAFLKQYRDQCESYPNPDLLNAMFGAAARFVECDTQYRDHNRFQPPDMVWDVPQGWSDHFFEQSQTFITESSSVATLSKVQAIILIHNHSRNLDSKSSACWLLGGLAVRLAQGLGLYRDCSEWDIPDEERETRKRVWWALYVTDRFHSATLGRPISIRDEDNDVPLPNASALWKEVMDEPDDDDMQIDNDTATRFPSATFKPEHAGESVPVYQLFIQLIKLSEILGHILQGLYTPKAQRLSHEQGSDAIVAHLDHELTEWRFGFPKALQSANFADFDENTGYLSPVIAITLICYYGLLVLLHRPFIEHAGSQKGKARPSYSSFRIGSSAATRGIQFASRLEPRDFLMFPYAFSLYPVLQCCLIQMYNAKSSEVRISEPAKIDLGRGLALINRLKKMSFNADKLQNLLETLMENNDIALPSPEDMFAYDSAAANAQIAPTPRLASARASNPASSANPVASPIPSRLSDVGRGAALPTSMPQQQQPIIASELMSNSFDPASMLPETVAQTSQPHAHSSIAVPLLFQQSYEMTTFNEIKTSPATTTSSPSSMTEAFTLKQFGFETVPTSEPLFQMNFSPQDFLAYSNFVTSTMPPMDDGAALQQPQPHMPVTELGSASSASSSNLPTPTTSHVGGVGIATPGYVAPNPDAHAMLYQQMAFDPPVITSSPAIASSSSTSVPPPSSIPPHASIDATNMLFRNKPNNPFASVPTSMDWSEWNEWNQRNNQGISFK
ncbi:fungal-specific transcription factor domain-containing protein [Gongronella butleri]|nr:fungal-specific transcription factor domain-containing protein [Gongronella butleri]